MHMYLQWDPRVIGNTPTKKNSPEYKTPWPGNSWPSLGFLLKTLNIKAPLSPHMLQPCPVPEHSSGLRSPFCSSGDKTEQPGFLGALLRAETNGTPSSSETLPEHSAQPAQPTAPSEARLSSVFLWPAVSRCPSRSGVSPNKCPAHLVWSDVTVDKE